MNLKTETVEFGRLEDMLAEAYSLGYRKGVEDARQHLLECERPVAAEEISDFLEQISDSNRPYPGTGAGNVEKI